MGKKPIWKNKKEIVLATCFRCGHKYDINKMGHVGNDTYECLKCLFSAKK